MIAQLYLMTATVKLDYRWFHVAPGEVKELPISGSHLDPLAEELALYTREETPSLIMFYAPREGRWGAFVGSLPSTRRDHFGRVITTSLFALFDNLEEARGFVLNALDGLIGPHSDTARLSKAVRLSMKETDTGDDLLTYVESLTRRDDDGLHFPAASREALIGNYPRHLDRVSDELRSIDLGALVSEATDDDGRQLLPFVVVAQDVDEQRLRGIWRALTNLLDVSEMVPNKKKVLPVDEPAPYASRPSRNLPVENVYIGVAIITITAVAYLVYRFLKH